jgi:hypothetical protein
MKPIKKIYFTVPEVAMIIDEPCHSVYNWIADLKLTTPTKRSGVRQFTAKEINVLMGYKEAKIRFGRTHVHLGGKNPEIEALTRARIKWSQSDLKGQGFSFEEFLMMEQ